jgi:ferrous iron transport protein A
VRGASWYHQTVAYRLQLVLEFQFCEAHTELTMQLSFKKKPAASSAARDLSLLKKGQSGILAHIDLPEDDARRLMELGFLPGHSVFQVDGSEVALRRETAVHLILR